jgi:hypothetical protein
MMDMDIDDEAKEMYGDGDGDDSLPEEEVQEDEEDVAMEPRAEAADTEEDATPIASHKLEKKSNAKGEPGALNEADYEDQDDIEDDNDDDDDDDDDEIEDEEDEEDEDTTYESQMQPRGGGRRKHAPTAHLTQATSDLRDTVEASEDPLQNALVATDEVVKSVMTGGRGSSRNIREGRRPSSKGAAQKEKENNGTGDTSSSSRAVEASDKKTVGVLAGARPTSKADAVSFDESEPDSPDDNRSENGRITLPTATTQPIAKFSNTAVQDAKPQGKVGAPSGVVH